MRERRRKEAEEEEDERRGGGEGRERAAEREEMKGNCEREDTQICRCMKACYARDTSPDTKLCAEKANKIVVRNPPRKAMDFMEAKVVGTGFASPLTMEHAVPISELNQQLRSREK